MKNLKRKLESYLISTNKEITDGVDVRFLSLTVFFFFVFLIVVFNG